MCSRHRLPIALPSSDQFAADPFFNIPSVTTLQKRQNQFLFHFLFLSRLGSNRIDNNRRR